MTKSLLEHLLLKHPADSAHTLAAIESGELTTQVALQENPLLIPLGLKSLAKSHHNERRSAERVLDLFQALETRGWGLWVKPSSEATPVSDREDNPQGLRVFESAIQIENPDLLDWVCRHSNAPVDLIARYSAYSSETPPKTHPVIFSQVNNPPMLAKLIELGFDPHLINQSGNTLLHLAKNTQSVQLLLQAGVNTQIKNSQGKDALSVWSETNILLKERQEMEALVNSVCPLDPNQVAREFGSSMKLVGVQQSKTRLSEAGLDPKTLRVNGMTPAELVICEAMNETFQMNGYISAHPPSHRKWRKLVLAAIRLQGRIDPDDMSEYALRIRNAVLCFLRIDQKTQGQQDSRDLATLRKASIDTSVVDLLASVGLYSNLGFLDEYFSLRAKREWFERMQSSGLLLNGSSSTAILLLKTTNSGIWSKNSMSESEVDDFLELAKHATRYTWDKQWGDALTARIAFDFPIRISETLLATLCERPFGLGSMLLMASPPHLAAEKFSSYLESATPHLLKTDPWLMRSIDWLADITPHFSNQLNSLVEQLILDQTTPTVGEGRPTRRM